jgi:hypothetical protein
MMTLPAGEPVLLLDNDYIPNSSVVSFKFKFTQPVSSIKIFGTQTAGTPATNNVSLSESLDGVSYSTTLSATNMNSALISHTPTNDFFYRLSLTTGAVGGAGAATLMIKGIPA